MSFVHPSGWCWLYWMRNGKFTRKSGVARIQHHGLCWGTVGHWAISNWAVTIAGCKKLWGSNGPTSLSQKYLPVCVPACAASLPAASSLSFGRNVVWQGFFPLENLEELGFHVHSWRSFSGTSTGSLVDLKQFTCNRPWSNCLGALLFCRALFMWFILNKNNCLKILKNSSALKNDCVQ